MSHAIEQRIAELRRRVRRLVVAYGVCWTIAAVLGALIALGLTDYLLRLQDRGLRVICSLLVLGALGWSGYRFFYLPLLVRLRDVDLALRLQRRFPGLQDRLVSTVEFLHQSEDDPTAGSAALRRAVIAQTTAETERLDFTEVLDRRPPIRAAMVTAAVCLVAAILVVLDPVSSGIAVARLVKPFGSTAWHHIAVAHVERVARGQTFEAEVIDTEGARLPRDLQIHYRFRNADGSTTREADPLHPAGARAVARRENVTRPFSYCVEGGDALTEWIEVEVIEPPAISSLRVRLIPPAYTGWPPEETDGNLRVLVGTRLQVAATATRPLSSAELCLEGGQRAAGELSEDGLNFSVGNKPADKPLRIDRSGSYGFELTDREGLVGNGDRWEIRAVPDTAPSVVIERPAANLFVTPQAVVPLRLAAKDDLAIREIAIVVRGAAARADGAEPPKKSEPSEPPPEETVSLYVGPERVAPQPPGALSGGTELGEQRVVEHRWDLGPLALEPGTQLGFHATVADYKPQSGSSPPRLLVVITPEELQEKIAGRQDQVLAEIARVLKMQRDCRTQVEALRIRLAELERLERLDVDRLQGAELNQRQVRHSLTSTDEGVSMHALALLADLENNQVDSPDVQRRMEALLREIDRLDREHLTPLGRELTAAIKAAEVALGGSPPDQADPAVARSLEAGSQHQEAVIASLEAMLSRLGQWENYRRFHRDVSQLLRDQEDLQHRTGEVGRRTLAKDLRDLKPQETADLMILAGEQLELARRLDRTGQEMDQASAALVDSDPLAAETVADAVAEARRLAIGGQMRTAGGQLRENRIAQAAARQKQIVADLQEVLDVLANRRRNELARLVRKLQEAETDLADLAGRQAGLCSAFVQNEQEPDQARRRREQEQLGGQQRKLAEETERMARRLERLLAERAGQTTGRAAEQMGRAGSCAGAGNGAGACENAAAAQQTLEEARKQLDEQRRRAELELAMEQLAQLEDALKHLRRQQQNAITETQRYEELRRSHGQLTRGQAAGLSDLGRLQRSLQTDAVKLADKLAGAGAFQLALSGAADAMGRAAALLEQSDTGTATVEAEQHALGRLDLVLKALEPEEPGESAGGQGGPGGQQGMPGQGVRALAELKLLKLLQQEINLRTQQLHEAVAAEGQLTDERRREYLSLSREQGRLAELTLELLQTAAQNPEDNPDALPDVRIDPDEPPPKEDSP